MKVTVDPSGRYLGIDLLKESADALSSLTYLYDTRSNDKIDLRQVLKSAQDQNM
ncbi:hypothetical protein [Brevibacillus fulvus]|uniref:Uncharacterized protein n=1 Tax=Brevibacillus fulvus TaxID=1125967 RepID=A0A939BSF7_9BACL|nr:hypothetical protein [Brevibacillus fulvus]MBM7590657.1 hypothetical protein [Brevibacillus fulvus]